MAFTQSARYDRVPSLFNEQETHDTATSYDNSSVYTSKVFDGRPRDVHGEPRGRSSSWTAPTKNGATGGVFSISRRESQRQFDQASTPPNGLRRSMLHDSIGQILLCLIFFLLPLALTVVLLYLVYANLQSTDTHDQDVDILYSITEGNETRPPSRREYYVDYSATRLVFISSLSSTLALALVPVGMTLFTYKTASTLQKDSVRQKFGDLPTPYQFELCLRLLGGNVVDLYRYFLYLLRRASSRVPVASALIQAVLMLAFLLALAIAITITDALLHIKTSTVQYHRTTSFESTEFLPSRRLRSDCLRFDNSSDYIAHACNIIVGGSGGGDGINGSSEAYRILGNVSETTSIELADDGKTAIIVAANKPPDVSYSAQSFASSTVCETVTKRCGVQYSGDCDACQLWKYNCTSQNAGVVVSGNYTTERATTQGPQLAIQYYNSSSKTENGSGYLQSAFNGNVWSSVVFDLPSAEYDMPSSLNGGTYYNSSLDLIRDTRGTIWGIFSCNTTLSIAQYTANVNGSVSNISLTPMNDSASAPFFQAIQLHYGDPSLQSGLNLASVSTSTSEELTYQYSRTFDRTILGLTAGYLDADAPQRADKMDSTQVAKVPVPEFIALNVLNLLLTAVGALLTATAFVLRTRPGVVDLRARLDIGALVAALFEDSKLDQTAHKVEDMYAELRGLSTSRVMASDGTLGSRRGFVAVREIDGVTE